MRLLKDFLQICRQEKKWLLVSFGLMLLLIVAALFLFASNSGISWALYPSK